MEPLGHQQLPEPMEPMGYLEPLELLDPLEPLEPLGLLKHGTLRRGTGGLRGVESLIL